MKRFLPSLLLALSILLVAGMAWRTFAQIGTNAPRNEDGTTDGKRKKNNKDLSTLTSKPKAAVKPPESFQPSERVPIDMAVDFPVDI